MPLRTTVILDLGDLGDSLIQSSYYSKPSANIVASSRLQAHLLISWTLDIWTRASWMWGGIEPLTTIGA